MTNAWQDYHRRAATLRQTQQRIERAADGVLPWDEAIADVFAGPDDLLRALQQSWSQRLAARVDMALELGGDPLDGVRTAVRETAARSPGLRRVLDGYADRPALRHPRQVEHRLLAVAAGLASFAEPVVAAERGASLVAGAQALSHAS
ncbi:MAG: hypothetical protein ACRDUA_00090 [Micromonosporaceae bacterium]